MGRETMKPNTSIITSFTPCGDYFSVLSSEGVVKLWNTSSGKLLAEWADQDRAVAGSYSCMACSFIQQKRKKDHGIYLLAFGTQSGDVLAVNILTDERKWTSYGCHPGGASALSFTKKGHTLYTAGADGMVFELDIETGEQISKFKASKTSITSLALSFDEKLLAVASKRIHVFSLENKKEIQKFSSDVGPTRYIAVSDGGKVVSLGFGEKQLQVWEWDEGSGTGISRAILSMQNQPASLACRNSANDEGLVVLSVSERGIAYIWDLVTIPQDEEVTPSRILVKSVKTESGQSSSKKTRIPLIAARLHDMEKNGLISVFVAYGPLAAPQFNLVEVASHGEEILLTASDETSVPGTIRGSSQENEYPGTKKESADNQKRRAKKKRAATDLDAESPRSNLDCGHLELDNIENNIDIDENEPTMGEKLASLNLLDEERPKSPEKHEVFVDLKTPRADSVHVLLKQALHADDRTLLLECLSMHDEKVIMNSISLLNPSDVIKLLKALVSMIESRGPTLSNAIPWLRYLLLQHASGIMSQESSIFALNSLYQLIESRISAFKSALQLSSCVEFLVSGTSFDLSDDEHTATLPLTYEDTDESDDESVEIMEIDDESQEEPQKPDSDAEGNDVMSD